MRKLSNILSESAWGDMMRRGSGEEIRTEDDVNLMDGQEFLHYIKSHYKCKDDFTVTCDSSSVNVISIKLFEDKFEFLQYYFTSKQIVIDKNSYILEELKNKYHIVYKVDFYQIFPKKEDDVTNRFFIEVLDFVIDTINGPKEIDKS